MELASNRHVLFPNETKGKVANTIVGHWLEGREAQDQIQGLGMPDQDHAILLAVVYRLVRLVWPVLHAWPSPQETAWANIEGEVYPLAPAWVQESSKAFDAISLAFSAVEDWPNGFFRFLDVYRGWKGHWPAGRRPLGADGVGYVLLSITRPDERLGFVEKAYYEHARRSNPDGVRGRSYIGKKFRPRIVRHAQRGRRMDPAVSVFAKKMGVTVKNAELILETYGTRDDGAGQPVGETGDGSSDRAVQDAIEQQHDGQSWQVCADYLGLDLQAVGELVDQDILTLHRHDSTSSDESDMPAISCVSVWQLRKNLARRQVALDDRVVTFAAALEDLKSTGVSAASLVAAIMNGEILVALGPLRFADCLISANSLSRFIEIKQSQQELSRAKGIADALMVDPTAVVVWLQLGLLPRKPPNEANGSYELSSEDIDRFRESFVRKIEGPELLGIAEGLFDHRVGRGLIPEVGAKRSVRTGLFERETIESLAPRRSVLRCEACRVYGISHETIQAWVDEGLLAPLTAMASKYAGYRRYALDDIERLVRTGR